MRPTDENQHGSTRPNLMPRARRPGSSGILAALDHDSSAHPPAPLRWLLAGGAVIVVLIAAIAWLAHSNATTRRVLPVAGAQPHPVPDKGFLLARLPAAIIDETAEATPEGGEPVPPLVMLPPAAKSAPAAPPHPVALRAPPPRAPRPAPAAARRNPPPPAPRAEADTIDSDTALISAIVAHSSRHAAERAQQEQAACGQNKKCKAQEP